MINTGALTLGNITWLVAAMGFVIAPHVERLPWWASLVCLGAGAWRWWIARTGHRTPGWIVMMAIAVAITAAAFVEYKRLFGREVGVMLLIVMLCLKVLEMRMKRDAMVVIFLGFFLALTNFLYSQTILMGAYMLGCVWLLIATLIGFNRINSEPTIGDRLKPALAINPHDAGVLFSISACDQPAMEYPPGIPSTYRPLRQYVAWRYLKAFPVGCGGIPG
jgi:hypothetical protein